MVRMVVNVTRPLKAKLGELTKKPPRLLLPWSQLATFCALLRESLRIGKSISFDSLHTLTLKVALTIPFVGVTSVGAGTASSSAKRVLSESRRGMALFTRLLGILRKYGRP